MGSFSICPFMATKLPAYPYFKKIQAKCVCCLYNSEESPAREVWCLVSVVPFMQSCRALAFLPNLGQVSHSHLHLSLEGWR